MGYIGEIKLFAYDDLPYGYLTCEGQSLQINKYPKLFMMIGTKYGKTDEVHFTLPNMQKDAPDGMMYCIAIDGEVPRI